MKVDLQKIQRGDKCELAKQRWNGAWRWRFIWDSLIFVVGLLLLATVALAIWLIFVGKPVGTVVTAAGVVAEGAAVWWLLRRRGEYKQEELDAWEEVKKLCPDVKTESA